MLTTTQPTNIAPKNRAGQPQGNAGLLFRVSEMYFFSPDQLPTFSNKYQKEGYERYCPNIETITAVKGDGHWNYKISIVGDMAMDCIVEQVKDLAEYYASEDALFDLLNS